MCVCVVRLAYQSLLHSIHPNIFYCWISDIFFFLIYSLVGYPPFSAERNDMKLPAQILNGNYSFPKQFWGDITDDGELK